MRMVLVTHKVIRGHGQGRINLEVALEALRRGYTVHVIASQVDDELSAHASVSCTMIDVARWPTQLLSKQMFALKSSRKLREIRRPGDVVIGNGFVTWGRTDLNMVHFVHGDWIASPYHDSKASRGVYGMYQWLYAKINARLELRSFDAATRLVAVSHQVKNAMTKRGVNGDKIDVIHNGVDLMEFSVETPRTREELELPADVRLALFVGDIRSPRKNMETVLKVIKRLPDLHLAVVGDSGKSPFVGTASDMGIADRVHFLGFRRDVPDLMRASDLLLFPSRYDPFGLVILEAMACGLPVVTASTVGASELVSSEAGIVVDDPDDVEALVTAVSTAESRASSMRAAAVEIASRNGFDTMVASYMQRIDRLSGNDSKPAEEVAVLT